MIVDKVNKLGRCIIIIYLIKLIMRLSLRNKRFLRIFIKLLFICCWAYFLHIHIELYFAKPPEYANSHLLVDILASRLVMITLFAFSLHRCFMQRFPIIPCFSLVFYIFIAYW